MNRVVVSVDGSAPSRAAIRWCVHELAPGTTVIAICAFSVISEFLVSVPPLPSDSERRIEDVFEHDWCAPLAEAGFDFTPRLVHEPDAAALVDTAGREHPDALILGKEPHHTFADLFSVSPLHQVLHRMPCPIILVPADWAPEGPPT